MVWILYYGGKHYLQKWIQSCYRLVPFLFIGIQQCILLHSELYIYYVNQKLVTKNTQNLHCQNLRTYYPGVLLP